MKNILVVDDNALIKEVLVQWIRSTVQDARILTAGNGKEALEILKNTPVSLVMTDLQMPVMNGYELIEYCKENRPEIKVYAMTGERTPEVARRLGLMGVPMTIEKPFDFGEVAGRIRDALADKPGIMDASHEQDFAAAL
ncbi:MAG TPA: response regulator [Nitrospirota bacterium]|nr:response regulator [Nitrospirota bacterium]